MRVIAVALQTCDRPAYTARTLASFTAMNDRARFVLVHGDDGSTTAENHALAARYGFTTVVRHATRQGMTATRLALVRAAAALAPWVLLLENDIDFLRPFPWPLFEYVTTHAEVYTLRLFGVYKDAAQTDACLTYRKKYPHTVVHWQPLRGAPEPAEIGRIHWTAQPSVTRADLFVALLQTDRDPDARTVRVVSNVTSHFGAERTAGRVK